MDNKTPLYERHVALNGKIVSYASFLMPVQYETGIITEHLAVRNKAGLFDVSHMGEFILKGEDALKNLNYLITNDFSDLEIGKARYGILCTEQGYAVDDLIVYHTKEDEYLIVVNAANTDKDYDWMKGHIFGNVKLEDISSTVGQIALQGPNSHKILSKITSDIPEVNYSFLETELNNKKCIISCTGYTGEEGYEIYTDNETIVWLWDKLLEVGYEDSLIPCGLGCRDTLRLEAGMPLYGHELGPDIKPTEVGLKMFVKFDKDFIGKDALLVEPTRRKIGLELVERGIARENYKVSQNGVEVGYVTSGTFSPTLNKAIAVALVNKDVDLEEPFEIDVRNKGVKAERIKMPFYRRRKN